jgi:D-tyrosyl-tRNA(Tyr) deacylase
MNFSILELKKEIMIVSQFTLYADCKKGNRPSFTEAAPPTLAELLYDKFVEIIKRHNLKVATGKFGEIMEIETVQDGPVTIVLDTKEGLKDGS